MPASQEDAMLAIAINGSPRQDWNTATLLDKVLEGASAAGCRTELIHLYRLAYTGCKSCFHCKRVGGRHYGKCVINDDLKAVLEKLAHADILIFGSPVYFGNISGMMLSFLERLLFPYFTYDSPPTSLAPKKARTACVYTMNLDEARMRERGYPERFDVTHDYLGKVFNRPEVLYVTDTLQFSDYSKYHVKSFSGEKKQQHRERHFPTDLRHAFELGVKLGTAGA